MRLFSHRAYHNAKPTDKTRGQLANEDGTAVRMLARLGVSSEVLVDRLHELRSRDAG